MFLFLISLAATLGLLFYASGYPAPEDPNYGKKLTRKSNALLVAAFTALPLWIVVFNALHAWLLVLVGHEWAFYGFETLDHVGLLEVAIALGVGALSYLGMRFNRRLKKGLQDEITKKGGIALQTGDPIYDMVRAMTDAEGINPPMVYLMPMDVANIMVTVLGRKRTPIIVIDRDLSLRMHNDELAAVLLHELGHIKNYDIDRSVLFNTSGSLLPGMALIYALISIPVTVGWAPLMMAFFFGWMASLIFTMLLSMASSRRNEFHSDYFSARRIDPQLLVAGLFMVEEAQRAFYRRKGLDPDKPMPGWVRLLASHPSSGERYEAMRRLRKIYHK